MSINFTPSVIDKNEIKDIIVKLEGKKTLEWCMIHYCTKRGFRFFIRECYGKIDYYRWLSEDEVRKWLWSSISSLVQYQAKVKKDGKRTLQQKNDLRVGHERSDENSSETEFFNALREICHSQLVSGPY